MASSVRASRVYPNLEPLEDRLLLSTTVIRGVLFEDRNGNGRQDSGEPGLSSRVVFLDANSNGRLDSGEVQRTTNTNGNFEFSNLQPGRYLVGQVLPPGWSGTQAVISQAVYQASDADRLIGLDRFRSDPRFAGINGQGFSIVVLDTGIDSNHSFFGPDSNHDGRADSIVYQYDFLRKDTVADDVSGHGTHISSLIASRDPEYPGIAPGVNLIVLKVLNDSGSGNFANIEKALQWVIGNISRYNIAGVNLSFGDGGFYARDMDLHGVSDELSTLAARNVVVIGAAGNGFTSSSSLPGIMYPAADRNVIAVGSVWDSNLGGPWIWDNNVRDNTTAADRIVSFSQRADGMGELFAPGIMLVGAAPGSGTSAVSGTSGSAAIVSGMVALAQQLAREKIGRTLTTSEIRNLLNQTGRFIRDGDDENDNVPNTGAGYRRVDMFALGEAILGMGSVTVSSRVGFASVQLPAGSTVSGVALGSRRFSNNTAPTLTGDGVTQSVDEDMRTPGGVTVATLLGSTFRDSDSGARRGIAVVRQVDGGVGRWQYSIDGGRSWSDLNGVSQRSARLLRDSDKVRFVPNANANGYGTLEYRAWDQTSGNPGTYADLTRSGSVGGTSAFGVQQRSVRFTIRAINDAPSLRGPGRLTSIGINATNTRGDRVADILAGKVVDVDGPGTPGMAIVSVSGRGVWQYSRDYGRGWIDLSDVSAGRAKLLGPDDRIRFVPAHNWTGTAWISYRAWDRRSGTLGGTMDLRNAQSVGGITPYSREIASSSVTVSGAVISETTRQTVAQVLTRSGITLTQGAGIAVMSLGGYGRWSYSLDGAIWRDLFSVYRGAAVLLPGNAYLRFTPLAGRTPDGRISFRVWDGRTGYPGGTANLTQTTVRGFQSQIVTINWSVFT